MKFAKLIGLGIVAITLIWTLNPVFAESEDDRFRFEGVPATIEPFDDFSFTLEALDGAGEVDDAYVGEVHFYTDTDTNAIFPDDYEFQLSDAGVKEFTGFSFFTEEGTHELKVVDVDNDTLMGSVEVVVSSSGGSSSEGSLTVLSPTSGTSTSNVISFTGTTDPGLQVRVFMDGEILGSVDADVEGDFVYDSPVLDDGLYVFTVETDDAESSEISVNVNTQGVEVSSVSFSPEDFSAGSTSTVTVNFAQEVSDVSIVINGVRSDLIQSDTLGRAFSGLITMPAQSGTYNLSVTADSIDISNVGTLTVTDPFSLGSNQGSSDITFFVPSQVQNVQGSSTDRRVDLTWNAATDNTGIDHYAIFYGVNQGQLTSRVDTNSNSTSWYVPNLENGRTYYFQVYGVDTEGNIGDQGSTVLSAIPGVSGSTTLHGASTDQVQVDQTSETGPGDVVFLILGSLILGYFVNKKLIANG